MEVKLGQSAPFRGQRGREVTVTADGRVDPQEARGADLFLPGIQDARVGAYLRSGDVADLGPTWQTLPNPNPQRHKTLAATTSTQEFHADFASRTLTLATQGEDGRHTITAHFERGSNRLVPQTITETFEP